MTFFKVCSYSELTEDKVKKYEIDGVEILLVRSFNSEQVYAFDNTCNHQDKPLEKGKWNKETAEITCPFHKAIFNIKNNGAVMAPPACVNLPVYKTDVRLENNEKVVYIELD